MSSDPCLGARILVVEDSQLFAEVLCEYLRDQQLVPIGPVGRVETACSLARESEMDAAIVDLKLADRFSFPVCSILVERRIPFLFLTGYGELSVIPTEYRSVPLLSKPFQLDKMRELLRVLLIQRSAGQNRLLSFN